MASCTLARTAATPSRPPSTMPLRAVLAALLSLSAMLLLGLTDAMMVFPDQTNSPPLGEIDHPPLGPRDASACKLPADSSVTLSSGFGYNGMACTRTTGILRGFMMFIDFPDAPHDEESAEDAYDFFLPDAANWYRYASYGKMTLDIKADMRAFYRMPASSGSYQMDSQHFSLEGTRNYITDALYAYTFNGQRMPGADILYIVPTISARAIVNSHVFMEDTNTRDGELVAFRTVVMAQDVYSMIGYMGLVHETAHAMCLAELYPVDERPIGAYVGGWDVMGVARGPSPDFFAWDKWRLGWLADELIACVAAKGSSRHVLSPLYSETPGLKAVVIARDSKTALVAEFRLDGGVDTATCSPGLLLYTVNTKIDHGKGPIRVIDANPDTNGCDREPLNDATLSITHTKSLMVRDWGVNVTILSQDRTNMTITVDYK